MSNTAVEEDEFDLDNHPSRNTFNTEKFQKCGLTRSKALERSARREQAAWLPSGMFLYACNFSLRLFKHGHYSLGRMHGVRGSSHYVGGNSAIH